MNADVTDERATAAKQEVVNAYLDIATALRKAADALASYSSALAAAPNHTDLVHLLASPISSADSASSWQVSPSATVGAALPTAAWTQAFAPLLASLGVGGLGSQLADSTVSATDSSGGQDHPSVGSSTTSQRKRGHDSDEDEDPKPHRSKPKVKRYREAKDPAAPKGPASAYILFQNEVKDAKRREHPGQSYTQIMRLIADDWAKLDPVRKKTYLDTAEAERAKFKRASLDFNAAKYAGYGTADTVGPSVLEKPVGSGMVSAANPVGISEHGAYGTPSTSVSVGTSPPLPPPGQTNLPLASVVGQTVYSQPSSRRGSVIISQSPFPSQQLNHPASSIAPAPPPTPVQSIGSRPHTSNGASTQPTFAPQNFGSIDFNLDIFQDVPSVSANSTSNINFDALIDSMAPLAGSHDAQHGIVGNTVDPGDVITRRASLPGFMPSSHASCDIPVGLPSFPRSMRHSLQGSGLPAHRVPVSLPHSPVVPGLAFRPQGGETMADFTAGNWTRRGSL